MEVLEILKKSGKELYPEDLDFFETELATGGHYNAAYQAQCRMLIQELRAWLNGDQPEEKADLTRNGEIPKELVLDMHELVPKGVNPAADMTPEQLLLRDIARHRGEASYKSWFKKYMAQQNIVDAAFVEKHFSFFEEWEMNGILSVRQLGEPFLEKYFGALDHDKIARYQFFSEGFFMKHFAQLDYTIVLLNGKNEWRKRENRSKQLDVFLRLKGVKI